LSKKFTVNLHDGDRLSYTQAEELSLATVYRSQQLYTAEQWLNCKKRSKEHYPLPFSSLSSFQWRRNRGFRQFNEPGPPSSWGPREVGPQKNFRQDS